MMKAENEQEETKRISTYALTRRQRRELQVGSKNQDRLWLIGIVVITVVLIAMVVLLSNRNPQLAVGNELIPSLGNSHVQEGSVSPIAYNSTPPTSGPHYGSIAEWGTYTEPLRYEQVLHNLEDGGIAVYYQCEEECPEVVEQLEEIVAPYLDAGRRILLFPNVPTWTENNSQPLHQDMEARIAVTTWQRIEKYEEVEPAQIRAFIERYEGINNHQ